MFNTRGAEYAGGVRVARRAAVAAGLGLCVTLGAQAAVRTVTLTGDAAPGAGADFSGFEAPILADFDAVAFVGEVDDGSLSGLWSEGLGGTGVLAKVALEGEAAPSAGLNFSSFGGSNFFLNDTGVAAFENTLDDFSTVGFFGQVGTGDALEKILLGDEAAPGTTGDRNFLPELGRVGGFNSFTDTALHGSLSPTTNTPGGTNSTGIFAGAPTLIDKVSEVGDTAPGTTDDFSQFSIPALSDTRHLAFVANVGGGTHEGVWRQLDGGSLTRIAGASDTAPGGGTFSILFGNTVAINDAGDVAFTSRLTGTPALEGLWVARNGGIDRVMLGGEAAPDAGGETFGMGAVQGPDTSTLGIADNGDAFFTSILSDGRRGLFGERNGTLEKIALGQFNAAVTGDTAPDTAGLTFINVVRWAVNGPGQVAFLASLSDDTSAIFATDLAGNLLRIVGEGDSLEVAPGDFRTIEELNFFGLDGSISSNGNNRSQGLNDDGLIAFSATFFDEVSGESSAGVFVTAIPEPTSAALLAAGTLLLTSRSRRAKR